MHTIVEIIETQLDSGKAGTSFTFLEDGEAREYRASLAYIREQALKVAARLQKDATVLILLPQGISFIHSFFGCLYAGAIAVPAAVPTKNRGIEHLKNIVNDAGVSFCLTNRTTFANLQNYFGADVLGPVKWFFVDDMETDNLHDSFPKELPKPDEIAFLQYTSGSTGSPKGVMVTHENIITNSGIIQKCFDNSARSVSVCWLPSFHDMGLIDGIIQPVFSGFPSVLMSPVHFLQKPVRWLRAITDHGATYSGGPNFAFDLCSSRIKDEELDGLDLSALRCLYNGSESIRGHTVKRFVDRFSGIGFSAEKMFPCYGLAEATLAVTASRLGQRPTIVKFDEEKLRENEVAVTETEPWTELVGCGYKNGDTGLRITHIGTLDECSDDEIGEIWVSGKSITAGYRDSRDLSDDVFINHDGTRYLRTGDLGFLFQDELFVTGRIKELVIISGKNHHPQDIEQTVLQSHHALQADACAAFAVEVEQQEKLVVVQEIKRAFLRKTDYGAVLASIMADVSRKMEIAPYDVLLISPNELPKTLNGKVKRGECRQMWFAGGFKPLTALRVTPSN